MTAQTSKVGGTTVAQSTADVFLSISYPPGNVQMMPVPMALAIVQRRTKLPVSGVCGAVPHATQATVCDNALTSSSGKKLCAVVGSNPMTCGFPHPSITAPAVACVMQTSAMWTSVNVPARISQAAPMTADDVR